MLRLCSTNSLLKIFRISQCTEQNTRNGLQTYIVEWHNIYKLKWLWEESEMIIMIFKVVMVCNLECVYQHFRGTFHHHLNCEGKRVGFLLRNSAMNILNKLSLELILKLTYWVVRLRTLQHKTQTPYKKLQIILNLDRFIDVT